MDENSALFVYGTLVEPRLRERVIGRPVEGIAARLPGYERRRGRYFYVVRREGGQTEGLLLTGLSPRDFEILDRYEEVPTLYTRERVEVIGAKGRAIGCWIYLPTSRLICR
ncbi:MAG: gamma-glutamylcyclotransferase family protein [Candidatus Binataceae bacterium]